MKVEVLGPGCPRCQATEKNVKQAMQDLDAEGEVLHVYDPAEYARRGVMFTPAVMIDDAVMVSGKVPTVEELKSLLRSRMPAAS